MTESQSDLSKACIHTLTTRPWKLNIAVEKYLHAGVGGISVWRNYLDEYTLQEAAIILGNSGLKVVSLVRGGFFPSPEEAKRKKAIDDNIKMIDQAGAINAGLVVLVCGAAPGQILNVSREQIYRGIESIMPFAESNKIKLAVEPLHPVYSDTRSAINTLRLANELTEYFRSPWLGVVLDIYHLWWDPDLETEIERCGRNKNIFAVHLSDWRVPTRDVLHDRELMGRGIINIQEFIDRVKKTGYSGMYEVEIFSDSYWSMNQDEFLADIVASFKQYNFQ